MRLAEVTLEDVEKEYQYSAKEAKPVHGICPLLSIGRAHQLCVGIECACWSGGTYGVKGGCGLVRRFS